MASVLLFRKRENVYNRKKFREKKGWGRNFNFLQIVDKMVKKIPVNQLHPQHDGIGMMNESPC